MPSESNRENPISNVNEQREAGTGPMVSFPMKYWNALLEAAGLAPDTGLRFLIEHVRKLRERAHGQWPAMRECASLLGLQPDTATVGDVLEKIRQLQLANSRGQWTYFRDAVTKALRAVPQGTHELLENYADRLVHVIDELRDRKYIAPSPLELESVGMRADSTLRDCFNELRAVKNQIKSLEEDWQRVTNLLNLGRDAGCREVLEKIRDVATGLRGVTGEELEMLGLREGTSYRELFDEVKRLKTAEIPKYVHDLEQCTNFTEFLGWPIGAWRECRDTLEEATAISQPAEAAKAIVESRSFRDLLDKEIRKFQRESNIGDETTLETLRNLIEARRGSVVLSPFESEFLAAAAEAIALIGLDPSCTCEQFIEQLREWNEDRAEMQLDSQDGRILRGELKRFQQKFLNHEETTLETLRGLIAARNILWSVRSAVGLPIGADFTEVLPRVTKFVGKVRELADRPLTIERAQELVGLLMVEKGLDNVEPNYFLWKLGQAIEEERLGDALLALFQGCQRDGTKLSKALRDAFNEEAINAESKLVMP